MLETNVDQIKGHRRKKKSKLFFHVDETDNPFFIIEHDINELDENGMTPLMWASAFNQAITVAFLLERGAQCNIVASKGETSLLLASSGGHHQVVHDLLESGADVDHIDQVPSHFHISGSNIFQHIC